MSRESARPPGQRRRSSALVVPQQARWHGRLAAAVVYGLIRTMDATLRYTVSDLWDAVGKALAGPVIFATWHNRLGVSLRIHQRFFVPSRPSRRLAAMVSASRDGGLLARILELFQIRPVRGSSSRRGHQALLEMVTLAEQGYDLAMTPDGPRGPRYVVQEGVIAVAQLTGLPIVPVSSYVPWKWQAKSWDRFQVPLPFSRVRLCFGELLQVPREAPAAEREQLRQVLETRLRELGRD